MAEYMLGSPLLWTLVAIPIIAGLVALLLRDEKGRAHALLAGFSWGLVLASLLVLAPLVYSEDEPHVLLDPLYANVPGLGSFALIVDGVSLIFAVSIAIVSLAVAIYSYRYMEHRFEELGAVPRWGLYFLLYQLFTAGMLGVVLATNTILFYLFLEVTLIPSFLLIALYGYGDRVRVGLLYVVWTHVGAALFLIAALVLGFTTGVYNFYYPGIGYVKAIEELAGGLAPLIFTLFVLGLAIKMALLGVHMWLPYAHAEAPTPISALLSPLLIGLGAYGLFRFVIGFFPDLWGSLSPVLAAWAFATMIYGGFMALVQRDVKRFLAYSSVSQMGYILLGLATLSVAGVTGGILHYMSHAFGKAVLFAVAGVLIVVAHTRNMDEMGGLAAKLPYTAAAALTGFLYLTGIPPTLGLLSEYLIARGLAVWSASGGFTGFTTALAIFMVAVTISTLYSFVGFKRMFLSKPGKVFDKVKGTEPSSMIGPILFLAAAGIIAFIVPEPLVGPAKVVANLVIGG